MLYIIRHNAACTFFFSVEWSQDKKPILLCYETDRAGLLPAPQGVRFVEGKPPPSPPPMMLFFTFNSGLTVKIFGEIASIILSVRHLPLSLAPWRTFPSRPALRCQTATGVPMFTPTCFPTSGEIKGTFGLDLAVQYHWHVHDSFPTLGKEGDFYLDKHALPGDLP